MDSLTQIALGAAVAAACVPPVQRRKGLLVGASLGTLPDLDVVLDYGGPVENFTMHRGFSHSLLVLIPLAVLVWLALWRLWPPVREAPRRWLAATTLVLVTHSLLDAHTAYGTQLWWPFAPPPTAWATIFIIDPLYTLPLLVAVVAVLIRPASIATGRLLAAGVVLSTAYLGWTWTARAIVMENARASLALRGIGDAEVFLTPTPFNSLLWRVVARVEGGHLEGLDSVVADDGLVEFDVHPSDDTALDAAAEIRAVERLRWFADGFASAEVIDDELVMTDLRMGQHPVFVFRHVAAARDGDGWRPIASRRLPTVMNLERVRDLWPRIWAAERNVP